MKTLKGCLIQTGKVALFLFLVVCVIVVIINF